MSLPPISPAAAGLRVQVIAEAEAGLMAALDSAQAVEAPPQTPPPAAAPRDPIRQAVADARSTAAVRQASLAPLFADLAQALRAPGLPPPVRAAIAQVLALQLPATGPFTAEVVRQAVARSGLFLEAHIAAGEPPPPDLKAALLTLQRAVAPGPPPQASNPKAATTTPPPVREAALTGQAATSPTLPPDAEPPAIVGFLRHEVEQAVARQTLHQLASLPDAAGATWMFEIPIATPQGTAVAQFEIDRDAQGSAAAASANAWRARFSIDVEPLGPVHVHLSLGADRAAVTLWAERDGSLERLRAEGEGLARELAADVVFHLGAPRRPSPGAGQFVDRTS
jgi:hypothetical protein